MDLGQDFTRYLFAVLAIVFGAHGLWKGEITYGPDGGSQADDRTLTGLKARIVSLLLAVSGVVMLFHPVAGVCLLIGTVLLPWLIDG